MSLMPGAAEHAALVGREQLGAVGPGPFLLPDEVALPLDVARRAVDGLAPRKRRTSGARRRTAGSASGRAGGSCERRNWTPSSCSVVPATPRSVSAPSGLKKLRSVQLASTPRALPGAVAELAGDRVRRRGFELDVEVDGPAAVRPARAWMSALATSVVAISARRRSSTLDRWNGSPGLNRAMIATWRALNGGWPLTRIAPNRATGPGLTGKRQAWRDGSGD